MKLSELTIIRSDHLPPRTMCVSPDLYDLFTKTPEEQQVEINKQMDNLVRLSEWIKKKGEQP